MNVPEASFVKLVNQLFDLNKKIGGKPELNIDRNLSRINDSICEMGITVSNPIGEAYSETRTDCEATIAGTLASDLHIVEVIKPIIYKTEENRRTIIQRAVVIVQSK